MICGVARIGLDQLTCPAHEARYQCERLDPHGPDGHWISDHTMEHEKRGDGWLCDFRRYWQIGGTIGDSHTPAPGRFVDCVVTYAPGP